MNAELIGTWEPMSPEWFAARRRGVTASEIAAVMGLPTYESPFSLYWRKLGVIGEQPDNDAMSLGRHLEPWIADRCAERHPEFGIATTGTWRNRERPWQVVNPDRLIYDAACRDCGDSDCPWLADPVSLLEIKTSGSYEGWGEDGSDVVPVAYRAQVLWQLDTLGLTEGGIACLFLHSRQIREYVISYDPEDIEVMRQEAQRFLRRVADQDPPPVDSAPATTAALKQLHPEADTEARVVLRPRLVAAYRRACARLREAEATKRRRENEIRQILGDAAVAVDVAGNRVATRTIYDRRPYTVRATRVDQLRPATPSPPPLEQR